MCEDTPTPETETAGVSEGDKPQNEPLRVRFVGTGARAGTETVRNNENNNYVVDERPEKPSELIHLATDRETGEDSERTT